MIHQVSHYSSIFIENINMTFDEVIRSSKLNLPISQKSDVDFKTFLFKILDDYLELLQKLDHGSFNIPSIKSTKATLIARQVEFVNGIKETINYYYNDLTPEQYQKLIELSSQSSQSFD